MDDLETLRQTLLEKPGAVEETPFGPEALVYKVGGKMFALIGWVNAPLTITLKCDPDEALFLRELFSAVKPGYYMNKQHWNTVTLDGSVPADDVRYMIDQSYRLVYQKLPARTRAAIEGGSTP